MNLVNLRGELINLDNVSSIRKLRPGEKELVDTTFITIDSYQIRFRSGGDDCACVIYGKQESQWRNDWGWLNTFAIDRISTPPRSPDEGGQ